TACSRRPKTVPGAYTSAQPTATRRYAKRQRNWFRHEPEVQWIPPAATVHEVVERLPAGWAEV
ncbi:MAG: hypothetical protein AAFU79_32105, partial [Myxococcota bacterium]